MRRKYTAHIEFFNDNDTSFESRVLRRLWRRRSFVHYKNAVQWLQSQRDYINEVKDEHPCSAETYILNKETRRLA